MERKLAAILAADVAGYSRLMGADEEGTLTALRAHREMVDGLIAAHRGRVFNTAGDSVIAEFASAVEATLCAVEIQQAIAGRNASVPKDKRLEFRIGINIGDVMAEGGNLFGDGVNVADRVQKLADPGGICVARNVQDHLRNKADLRLEPMGEHQVKNIAAAVSVYRVLVPGAARRPLHQRWMGAVRRHRRVAAAAMLLLAVAIGGLAAWPLLSPPPAGGFPRLAVLPFQDFSGGAAPTHYGEGVAEDLITLLSRFPDLAVVSRNASFAYKGPEISIVSPDESFTLKGKEIDPIEVGRELGVDYIIEGSIQKKGNGLRITAQLIDTQTNEHVWADGYEGADPSSLQDKTTESIVGALGGQYGQIRKHEYGRTKGKALADLDEYGYFLRADEIISPFDNLEDHDRGGVILKEGLEKFPDSALLRVALAWYHFDRMWAYEPPRLAVDLRRAGELGRQALASENPSPMVRCLGHRLMAYIHWYERDFIRAIADAEAAVALSPSDAIQLSFLSRVQLNAGNLGRALEWTKESMRLDPTFHRNTRLLAMIYYLTGEYEKSIDAAKQHELLSRSIPQDALWFMAGSYVRLGRLEEARATAKRMLDESPWATLMMVRGFDFMFGYKDHALLEREMTDLAQAGVPEVPFGYGARTADRLTTEEIKAMIFGHTIRGRDIKTGKAVTDVFSADGAISETGDSGPDTATLLYLDHGLMCHVWKDWGAGCSAIFRNPGGTPEKQNEFTIVYACCEFEFSVIK
jgi:adenylate cyclase